MQSLLIPEKSKPIICVFIRSRPIMDILLTLAKCQISLLLIVSKYKSAVHNTSHGHHLLLKCRTGKVCGAGKCKDKEILSRMPGSAHDICHIFPVRGKAPAHGQKVSEVVKAVFKGTPGIYRAHGKPAESPVIPGCGKPLWFNALRISAVLC